MIPVNVITLGKHEVALRGQALKSIEADAALNDHLDVIEAGMAAVYDHAVRRPHRDATELTVQKLGVRLFNDMAAVLSQGLAGYYQQAFDTLRDVVELQFLFDDFSDDRTKVDRWAGNARHDREQEFRPAAVRQRLDKRYEHSEQKRRALYQRLSTLASHASPEGFQLISPRGDVLAGPFFEPRFLKAVLEDAAVHGLSAAINFTSLLPAGNEEEQRAKDGFLARAGPWMEIYFPVQVEEAFARASVAQREHLEQTRD